MSGAPRKIKFNKVSTVVDDPNSIIKAIEPDFDLKLMAVHGGDCLEFYSAEK